MYVILLHLCLRHFDRKMVSSKPLDITGVQGELLTSYVHVIPTKVKKPPVFGNRILISSVVFDHHARTAPFPLDSSRSYAVYSCSINHSVLNQSFHMNPPIDVPPYPRHFLLVCETTTGDVTVDQGQVGSATLIQLMVAADYILIPDVERDTYPKDQPPGVKGA